MLTLSGGHFYFVGNIDVTFKFVGLRPRAFHRVDPSGAPDRNGGPEALRRDCPSSPWFQVSDVVPDAAEGRISRSSGTLSGKRPAWLQ
jgi:hypothetical protein